MEIHSTLPQTIQYVTNNVYKPEGIGSLMQYILSVYFLCLEKGYRFVYTPLNFEHGKHENKSQLEWDNYLNNFIKKYLLLPINDKPKNITNIMKINSSKDYLDKLLKYNPKILNELKTHFHSISYPSYFDKNKINIAVHIRVLNSVDTDNSPKRELYEKNNNLDIYYHNCLNKIINFNKLKKSNIVIHIYSQNIHFDHYKDLISDNVELKIHKGNDLLSDIYHMCNADIFIASKSSLSALVNYYCKGITISRNGFWHTLINVIYNNIKGTFNIEQENEIISHLVKKQNIERYKNLKQIKNTNITFYIICFLLLILIFFLFYKFKN